MTRAAMLTVAVLAAPLLIPTPSNGQAQSAATCEDVCKMATTSATLSDEQKKLLKQCVVKMTCVAFTESPRGLEENREKMIIPLPCLGLGC